MYGTVQKWEQVFRIRKVRECTELFKLEEPQQGGLVVPGPFLSEFSTPFWVDF
jgi:hypothetical protein